MAAGLAPAFALLVVGSLRDAFLAGGANGYDYFSTYTVLALVLAGGYVVVRGRVRGAGHAARDSERLQHEVAQRMKELRAATIAAQAANLAKSQFLTAVSHELRTPLTAMLGYTQLLEDELKTQLAPRQHEFFETIQTSGDRLLAMINDLPQITPELTANESNGATGTATLDLRGLESDRTRLPDRVAPPPPPAVSCRSQEAAKSQSVNSQKPLTNVCFIRLPVRGQAADD